MGDVDNGGDDGYEGRPREYMGTLYLPFSFAVYLKLL